jgi:RNA polymerase sigma factor (sigma-70 family)
MQQTPLELFEANKPLAYFVAKKYRTKLVTRRDLDMADIVQECLLALWRAARTFDPARGFTFATYAVIVMRNHLDGHIFYWRRRPKSINSEKCHWLEARPTAEPGVQADAAVLLRRLSPRQRAFIVELFGLHGRGEKNGAEVAKMYGVSKQAVSATARKAIARMQQPAPFALPPCTAASRSCCC